MTSNAESEKPQVITDGVVTHSHSLLRLSKAGLRGNLASLVAVAEKYDTRVLYEPMRRTVSPIQDEIQERWLGDALFQYITHLAEPARSEAKLPDYFTLRFLYQLLYAAIEQQRFSQSSIDSIVKLQRKLSKAQSVPPLPTRVYGDRQSEGIPTAAVLDKRILNKVYAFNQDQVLDFSLKATKGYPREKVAQDFVRRFQKEAAKYDVIGIELNLLSFIKVLGHDQALLEVTLKEMLQARNPKHTELALVQSIAIQPVREDKGKPAEFQGFTTALDIISSIGFEGTLIYAPGGGDPREDIQELKMRFNRN